MGATCYMNATLQCLANIKPITNYFLDPNNYSYLYVYENKKYCLLTLNYIQVLIGLYCVITQEMGLIPQTISKK